MPAYKKKAPYKKGSYGRKKSNYKKKYVSGRLQRAIKAIALKNAETKHITTTAENNTLRHNSPYALPNLMQLPIGTGENGRIGDEIIGKYINIKFWFSSKQDRPNVMYRIIFYRAPATEDNTYSDIMENVSGNNMIDYVNTEKYSSIKQIMFQIKNNTMMGPAGGLLGTSYDWYMKENSKYISCSIPLGNSKIKYQNGETHPKYQKFNIKCVIFAYDAYGTLTTDDIATFAYSSRLYYKDP